MPAPQPDPSPSGEPDPALRSERTDAGAETTGGAAPAVPGAPSVPGYHILAELGRGGMGVVFRARQLRLNRVVALKMMLTVGSADRRELVRFLAEAEAVAAVRHSNVVQVYEYGEADGRPFMALELLPGGTLTERLKSAGSRRDPVAFAALIAKAARGVAAAHAAGIVHRDLKPGNVLLDEAGEPKVTDFGLAKLTFGEELTHTGSVMGTPAYMAPEQASGRTKFVGPQADVWSLGVILYEAVTGERPFRHRDADVLLAMIRSEEPPSARSRSATVPRDLDVICRKCLEKNPTDRYPTAAELADDLQRFVNGEPIAARPAGFAERWYKWARRKPTVAALWAALLFAGVSLAVGGAIAKFWRDAVASEATARSERQNAEAARDAEKFQRAEAERLRDIAKKNERDARTAEGKEKEARAEAERLRGIAEKNEKDARVAERQARRLEYARAVDLAHREVAANHYLRARELLASCRPELRGWEWHYVHRLCHPYSLKIEDCSHTFAISPDATRVAGINAAGWVGVWDTATGRSVFEVPTDGLAAPAVAFHPDGKRVLIAYRAQVFLFEPPRNGQPVRVGVHGNAKEHVLSAAFDRDGTRVVTGGTDGLALVWDLKAGTSRTLKGHTGPIRSVAFHPDNARVATAGDDGTARVWDAKTGETLLTVKGHGQRVWSVAFDPEGTRFVTGSDDGTARFWDAKTGEAGKTIRKPKGIVRVAEFDHTGRRLAVGGGGTTVNVFDPDSGKQLFHLPDFQADNNEVTRIAFSSDGKRLVTGGLNGEGRPRVWELPLRAAGFTVGWPQTPSLELGFTRDGKHVVTAQPGSVTAWDARTGEWAFDPTPDPNPRTLTLVAPDGSSAINVSGTKAEIWDVKTRTKVFTITDFPLDAFYHDFTPDGSTLAVLTAGCAITTWDLTTGKTLAAGLRLLAPGAKSEPGFHSLALSPDGKLIAAGEVFTTTVRVWDARTGKPVTVLRRSPGPLEYFSVSRMAFNATGTQLLVFSSSEVVSFDTKSWAVVGSRPLGASNTFVTSPDGSRFALGSAAGEVKILDAETFVELLTLQNPGGPVWRLVFSPDGKRLGSTSPTGMAYVWDATPLGPSQPPKP